MKAVRLLPWSPAFCVPIFKFVVPKINGIGIYFDKLDVMLPSVILAMLAGYIATVYEK